MQIQRGGGQVVWSPPKKTGPVPLKNHKATKSAFNVEPSLVRQQNAIYMAFRWRADEGPLMVVIDPSSPHQTKKKQKKNPVKIGPPLKKLSGSAHEVYSFEYA